MTLHLLPKLQKLLLDTSDWSLHQNFTYFSLFVGLECIIAEFGDWRIIAWPLYLLSQHSDVMIFGLVALTFIRSYIACGFIRMVYRLMTRSRSSI
ncbi:hypothetical protein B0H13DRAFT_2041242 [Mycena leptocephala]|nr:hypothetical protein B0H13DRAFT_2041242 [Mycena leptocephala]